MNAVPPVTAKGARIASGDEWQSWRRGECLILDDSFEHEVVYVGEWSSSSIAGIPT